MMKILKEEKGYSLLLTLMLVLVFSILGASLIAMTINGATKNEVREHITQSKDLAIKAETFIISDINKRAKAEVENTDILTSTSFNTLYNNLLKNYYCDLNPQYLKDITIDLNNSNTTGTSKVCIEKVEPYNESLTKMKVTFSSHGKTSNQETPLLSTYIMGAQEAKEALKYSVSTFIPPGRNGGNLFLHGGSEIEGDINVRNNLFISSYSYGLNKWLESIPSRTKNSNLFLGNNIYTFNNLSYSASTQDLKRGSNTLQYNNHLETNFNNSFYRMIDPIFYSQNNPVQSNNGFAQGHSPKLYKNEGKDVYYDVNEGFEDLNNIQFLTKQPNTSVTYSCGFFCSRQWRFSEINTRNTHTENSAVKYNGDLYITGNSKVEFKKPIYITGDLIIGDHASKSNSPSSYYDITLNGTTIYVGGKVRIQGVNLSANANLYVKGEDGSNFFISRSDVDNNVTTGFRQLTLKGIGSTGSLIVFSRGDTQIANISYNQPEASEITGYFYTEGAMELYGFASNLHINGGISANNIILNAMRGESLNSCANKSSSYQIISGQCFEKAANQIIEGKTTRLAVKYNKNILETYSKNQENIFSSITENDVIDKVQLLDRVLP